MSDKSLLADFLEWERTAQIPYELRQRLKATLATHAPADDAAALRPCPNCGPPFTGDARGCSICKGKRFVPAPSTTPSALAARAPADDAAAVTKRPRIVCLCGSTRFMQEFYDANMRETLAGRIVLTVGMSSKGDCRPTDEQKIALDVLHKQKINLADEVLVLNVDGYIGDSTRSEIAHAERTGKPIRYLVSDR